MSVWTWKDESDTHLHKLSSHLKARNTTVPDHTRLSTRFLSNHSHIVLIDWMKSGTKFDLIFSLTFVLFLLNFFFFFLLASSLFHNSELFTNGHCPFCFLSTLSKKWSKKIAAVDTFCTENSTSFFPFPIHFSPRYKKHWHGRNTRQNGEDCENRRLVQMFLLMHSSNLKKKKKKKKS